MAAEAEAKAAEEARVAAEAEAKAAKEARVASEAEARAEGPPSREPRGVAPDASGDAEVLPSPLAPLPTDSSLASSMTAAMSAPTHAEGYCPPSCPPGACTSSPQTNHHARVTVEADGSTASDHRPDLQHHLGAAYSTAMDGVSAADATAPVKLGISAVLGKGRRAAEKMPSAHDAPPPKRRSGRLAKILRRSVGLKGAAKENGELAT